VNNKKPIELKPGVYKLGDLIIKAQETGLDAYVVEILPWPEGRCTDPNDLEISTNDFGWICKITLNRKTVKTRREL
jgi:hypothetical protein